ncbi:hypothetical protein EYF80_018309 [Liparis tanakae]|uniref:Secreted protein n=1 Tax=Liparis tanakae TaxID=230148 RepID=A0A4Z2I1Y2_9TELE|nr:hypothetical protein EYF80_018309 [Liparis tanakae]
MKGHQGLLMLYLQLLLQLHSLVHMLEKHREDVVLHFVLELSPLLLGHVSLLAHYSKGPSQLLIVRPHLHQEEGSRCEIERDKKNTKRAKGDPHSQVVMPLVLQRDSRGNQTERERERESKQGREDTETAE